MIGVAAHKRQVGLRIRINYSLIYNILCQAMHHNARHLFYKPFRIEERKFVVMVGSQRSILQTLLVSKVCGGVLSLLTGGGAGNPGKHSLMYRMPVIFSHLTEVADMKRKTDKSKLFDAVFSRDFNRVRMEIGVGKEINVRDRDGRTCLFQAIVDGSDEIAALLIENGVDVKVQDNAGETALHFAAREHRHKIAELILKAGAEVDARDTHGNTPLARAVFASCGRGELIALLTASGADRESKNNYGMSPLDLAKSIGNYDVPQFVE